MAVLTPGRLIVDDETFSVGAIPGGAAAGMAQIGGLSRVLVLDDIYDTGLWPKASAPKYADFFTLTLTYDPVLSRVQAVGSGMDQFYTAMLERSPDGIRWTTVRGAGDLTVFADGVTADDYEFAANAINYYRLTTLSPFGQTATADITPTITDVWFKSIARPFLNQTVRLRAIPTSLSRSARAGVFDVVGRSLPVAVSDVRASRAYTLYVRADTDEAAENFDLLLASGDVIFIQAPATVPIRSDVYVVALDTSEDYQTFFNPMRVFEVPLREVAAPSSDVVGAAGTWQTVINAYETWSDLIADKATWADVLTLVGDPSEVIVP